MSRLRDLGFFPVLEKSQRISEAGGHILRGHLQAGFDFLDVDLAAQDEVEVIEIIENGCVLSQ
jgi:hypothetical protein